MKLPFQLKTSAEFDAAGFGTNAVDHLIRVPEYPAHNSKIKLSGYTQAAGGEIASTMMGLRRLGMKTAYAGRFGSDPAGAIGLTSLSEAGVDVTNCETVADAQTQIAFIVVDERTGERTIIWNRDDILAYAADEAPVHLATRAKVLHMTPHDVAACTEMALSARASGVIVSVDIDNAIGGIEHLLPLVDVCIGSADLPKLLTGISDIHLALADIVDRYGCAVTGVTNGAKGSLFYCDGQYFDTPGFEVPGGCIDTTGAGDAFRTGFVYGILTESDVEECARLGNAVAALKCRAPGARAGLPDKTELENFLKK
jgi:sugar/nucleoside kinase (ribokinase family)